MLRVTLKNAKSSSQRGLKRYSFDYSTSKDTMRAYNGDKYLEQYYTIIIIITRKLQGYVFVLQLYQM